MLLALVLAGVVAVACVLYVARPFLRGGQGSDVLDEPGPLEQRGLALAEERDRALAALKELEFDHRTGKVSDEDYRELVRPLRGQAAAALKALDPRAASAAPAEISLPLETLMELPEQPTTPDLPAPAPHEPPSQPVLPEPTPAPSTPPGPAVVPEPSPVPHTPPQQPQVPEPMPGGPQGV